MDQWEFTYVELFQSSPGMLKQQKYVDHVEATKAKIAQLGFDGWEPVGPVSMLMGTKAGGYQHLMFKRKLVEGRPPAGAHSERPAGSGEAVEGRPTRAAPPTRVTESEALPGESEAPMDREPPTNSDGLDDRGDRRATAHVVSVDPPLRTHTDFVDGKIQFSIRVDADVVLRVEFDGGAGAVCEILRPLVEDPVGHLFEFFLGHLRRRFREPERRECLHGGRGYSLAGAWSAGGV